MAKELSIELLRQILDYDPETGSFTWRKRPASMFADKGCGGAEGNAARWNGRHAGKPAFVVNNKGYWMGRLFKEGYGAHQVAWAIHHGAWPKGEIDHINCDRGDNRICNLRDATRAQNKRNVRALSTNKSGYKGVSWFKHAKLWRATITVDGKHISLGYFRTAEEAYAAYCEGVKKYHGEFGRAA